MREIGRQIVWDVESTGLNTSEDRIVEIGAIELVNCFPTGRELHLYCDPQVPVPEGAFAVHGLSNEFLSQFPPFADQAQAILDFFGDSETIAHNGRWFDWKILNAEMARAGFPEMSNHLIDTLILHRLRYPGRHASLDAILDRLGVDRSNRTHHGALLDSHLLVPVYVHLIGRDELLPEVLPWEREIVAAGEAGVHRETAQSWFPRRPARTTCGRDLENHSRFVDAIRDSMWASLAVEGDGAALTR